MVEAGTFRQDLYFRINVFPIYLPNLSERKEDIALLAKTVLKRLDNEDKFMLTDSAVGILKNYTFIGNIRELRNILARSLVMADTHIIDQHVINRCIDIDKNVKVISKGFVDLKTHELEYLEAIMQYCEGNKEQAALIANISLRSLYRKLKLAQN